MEPEAEEIKLEDKNNTKAANLPKRVKAEDTVELEAVGIKIEIELNEGNEANNISNLGHIKEAESAISAKNKRTAYISALCFKIRKVDDISNGSSPNLRNLHTACDRLKSAWISYEASCQVVLSLLPEDQVEDECNTFKEIEEKYKCALDTAKVILDQSKEN